MGNFRSKFGTYQLSLNLSFFLGSFLFSLGCYSLSISQTDCNNIFANQNQSSATSWPPQDWISYLQSIQTSRGEKTQIKLIQSALQPDPIGASTTGIVTLQGNLFIKTVNQPSNTAVKIDASNREFATQLGVPLTSTVYVPRPHHRDFRPTAAQTVLENSVVGEREGFVRERDYQHETIIPNTTYPWHTEIWPVETPPDSTFQAKCFVKTTIVKESVIIEHYNTAVLPVFRGGMEMVLNDIKRTDVAKNITMHELSYQHYGKHTFPALEDKGVAEAIAGGERQIKAIQEILAFVYPDYVKLRGWSESYIHKLYNKGIDRRFTTRFSIVRRKQPDGQAGEMLASLGLDTAPYGAVRFYNRLTQRFELSFGTISSMLNGRQFIDTGESGGYDFTQWNAPIQALGIEKNGELLPRPLVEVAHVPPSKMDEKLEKEMLKFLPQGMQPDLSYGVTFFEGRIGEPVSFKVVNQADLHGIAYKEILFQLADVFPRFNLPSINQFGQVFYTYNPLRMGQRLYGKFGYNRKANLTPIQVDGEDWPILSMIPQELMPDLSSTHLTNDQLAQKILEIYSKLVNPSSSAP